MAAYTMVGSMLGDIAGSAYEWNNIKHKPRELITSTSRFTDDTVLTYAIAWGMISGLNEVDRGHLSDLGAQRSMKAELAQEVKDFARKYPDAGYGGSFQRWALSDSVEPYGSWANGSAMRASFPGWVANSLEEAKLLGRLSAEITHDHEFGIKGAEVEAALIYLLRSGHSQADAREYAANYYDLSFTLDEIRPTYKFDVSCEGSVPQAIVAFAESEDFSDALRLAISIGGDSDTIAAIAGSIAEAYYPVPEDLLDRGLAKLDGFLRNTVQHVSAYLEQN